MPINELKYATGKKIKVSHLCHKTLKINSGAAPNSRICGGRWRLVVSCTLGPLYLYSEMLFLLSVTSKPLGF
jgi:hypothetical protein